MPRASDLYPVCFSAGFLASAVISILRSSAHALGFSQFSMPLLLGSFVTGAVDSRIFVGLPMNLALGGLLGMAYGVGFMIFKRASAALGGLFGVAHWTALGILLGFLPYVHPLVPVLIDAPGPFAVNAGLFDFLFYFLSHVFYGAFIGFSAQKIVFEREARRTAREREREEVERRRAA